ncbi:MAG: hypothetical protein EXR49_00465 [Dehalococcoidia bacterium]|nr:hypothetical protein [Dehalococcoidia bacterium]
MPGQEPDPLSKGQRWLSAIVAVTVAIAVLVATGEMWISIVTFLALGAVINIAFFLTKGKQ